MKRKRVTLVWAGAIVALLMLVIYFVNEIYPFGDRAFLTGDLYHQYLPFMQSLGDKLKAGEGLSYSFAAGIGSNYLALFVYYLACPLNALMLILPEGLLMEFTALLILGKLALSGVTFAWYLWEHYGRGGITVLLFSSFYALSGYTAAYSYNIMWMDAVWLFPLVLLGLERLLKKGEGLLYVVSLSACIYMNYYISIMICMFVVMYGVLYFVCESRKGKYALFFIGYSLLAGGLTAVLLVPEVLAILQTDFGMVTFPKEITSYFSLFDVLARGAICVECEKGLAHYPNIYAGVFVFVLVPIYLFTKEIPARTRLFMAGLAGFLLLSFSTNVLDFIWHGCNYPDSLPARQSFLYVFLLLSMSYGAFLHLRKRSGEMIIGSVVLAVGFFVLCEKLVEADSFTFGVFIGSISLVVLYGALFYFYGNPECKKNRFMVIGILLAVGIVECFVNTIVTSVFTYDRASYTEDIAAYDSLYERAKENEENGFFRVEFFQRMTKNDGLLANLPTATTFSSTMNSSVADLYEKLGMRHSKVYYSFDGATPLAAAILNVNYMLGEETDFLKNESKKALSDGLYQTFATEGNVVMYECLKSLPFGYVAPIGYNMPESSLNKPLHLQNQMVHDLGIEEQLFTMQEIAQIGDDIYFTAPTDGYYYMTVENGGTSKIVMQGVHGEKEFADLKEGSVLYAGFLEMGTEVVFRNNNESDTTKRIVLDAYLMDTKVLNEALACLSEASMKEVTVSDNAVHGTLSLPKDGVLVVSIPYEKGWRVQINGEEKEPELFADCFMSFSLPAGEYEIVMNYTPYGVWGGVAISIVSLMILGVIFYLKKSRR